MLLRFEDVWKSFGEGYVLKSVNLSVGEGELVAIVGPNGSGKTTLLRLASGLIAPSKGRVLVRGLDARKTGAKFYLGYIPHHPPLYGDLTVGENLFYYSGLYGQRRLVRTGIIEELGLADYMDRRVSELSYGWRKRVDIVRALIHDPPLLLMDEPFSGLDDGGRSWLMDLFSRATSQGKSVVITSPRKDLDLEARVLEIKGGSLVALTS